MFLFIFVVGNAEPPHNIFSILDPNFNTLRTLIEINQTQNAESRRLQFPLDVKPKQKVTYRSDQINRKDGTQTNGKIPRVQGIKNLEKKCLQYGQKFV